jgi:hypothetical protein
MAAATSAASPSCAAASGATSCRAIPSPTGCTSACWRLSARWRRLPCRCRARRCARWLHAAQANDAYWHGLFGGLYLPHLRRAIWNNLLKLEPALDALAPRRAAQGDVDLTATDRVAPAQFARSGLRARRRPCRAGARTRQPCAGAQLRRHACAPTRGLPRQDPLDQGRAWPGRRGHRFGARPRGLPARPSCPKRRRSGRASARRTIRRHRIDAIPTCDRRDARRLPGPERAGYAGQLGRDAGRRRLAHREALRPWTTALRVESASARPAGSDRNAPQPRHAQLRWLRRPLRAGRWRVPCGFGQQLGLAAAMSRWCWTTANWRRWFCVRPAAGGIERRAASYGVIVGSGFEKIMQAA